MPLEIENYCKKRLVDHLSDGDRVLIRFDNHGLGDIIMFHPMYERLKQLFPLVSFHLSTNIDQKYFEDTPTFDVDKVFKINFPETAQPFLPFDRADGISKVENCAKNELGIPFDASLEFTWTPKRWNEDLKIGDNCVGFVSQVQSCPSKGLDNVLGAKIWNTIKACGYTPIEVVFQNPNLNKCNNRPEFVDYSCRDMEPSVENAIAVIRQCKKFIGVNTGTFCMSVCLLGDNTLHLKKRYPFAPWYKRIKPVREICCQDLEHLDNNGLNLFLTQK